MDTLMPENGSPATGAPIRETAADRRAKPSFLEIAQATAEQFDVCRRPIPMRAEDPRIWTVSYIAAPCKSTIESVCPACAKKARHLRMTQCREGWHLDEEPVQVRNEPTEWQTQLLTARADLTAQYETAKADGDIELVGGIREVVATLDVDLRESGLRGQLPPLEPKARNRRTRSTRRRQDVPELPRRKVSKTTIGRQYAGRFRPSMFVTLTLPSYGGVRSDGSPWKPDDYDYIRAARDIVFFSNLIDRWIDNLRRVVGYEVQYWGTVEPQRRGAPHLHIAIRSAISHQIIRQVTAATYFQAWWPRFDAEDLIYHDGRMPTWEPQHATFVDPHTHAPLPGFDDALDVLATVENWEPAHVARFGVQVDSKGILGGTEESSRHIGYMTKYLTKSIGEVLEPKTASAATHYDRLHAELQHVPCSERCAVWLRYGIVPRGATDKTIPGRCRGKAHRRDTLGLPGRRVLNSRRWSGKTLPDHKADRAEFVRQLLAAVGIHKPDTTHIKVTPVEPGDQHCPPREHLILAAIAQRTADRAEYINARLATADPPGPQETSAVQQAA